MTRVEHLFIGRGAITETKEAISANLLTGEATGTYLAGALVLVGGLKVFYLQKISMVFNCRFF